MQDEPWLDNYPSDVPTTLEPYPEDSLFNILSRAASRHPNRPATVFFGKKMTYERLLAETERFSSVLSGLGVSSGDRVALILPNCPQYVIAYYAAARLGATVVGNNPLYTKREMAHQLGDCGPRVTVTLANFYRQVSSVAETVDVGQLLVTKLTDYMPFPLNVLAPSKFRRAAKHEGKPWPPVPAEVPIRRWKALMKSAGVPPPPAEVNAATDPAAFVYTGGTTGPSKGAMLSHFNIASNVRQTAPCITGFERGKDGVMCILPFFHTFGLVAMNFGIQQAGKLVLLPRFELERALKQFAKEKPAFFPGVPRLFVALNESPLTPKYDLKSVKACISGAAPLPAAVAEKFREVTGGARLVEGYGLTECSPVTHVNPFDKPRHGTIGIPVPDTDCKIVDLKNADREVPPGEPGELCIKGPQVMLGYWGKPEATAEMIRGGWLHTGDIAVMDEDGFFKIVDRMKDMILVSGFNVYPTEVEEVLFHNQKISKACVVGLPDERTGERVKAYVVVKPGESLTAEELDAWCRDPAQGLSGYRIPKEWEFRTELPETLIGKVLRRVLVEEERQKIAAS